MNVQEALDTLKSLGTEQNRKIYRRHGAGEDVYGVSFAHLKDLKKKIKTDHDSASGCGIRATTTPACWPA